MMRPRLISVSVICILLLSLSHCSGAYSDLCEKEKDCEGGNDNDVDACVEGLRGAEEIAAAYDCSDAFDKQVDCLSSKAVCKDKKFGKDVCAAESAAVSACTKAASGKGK
jgi:hypothetical protein